MTNKQDLYTNKSVSGVEIHDRGKVVKFIAILHDETLGNIKPFRVSMGLDKHGLPKFPPKQTFDEIIQAKRRQQMLLYGPAAATKRIKSVAPDPAPAPRASTGTRTEAIAAPEREPSKKSHPKKQSVLPPQQAADPVPSTSSSNETVVSPAKDLVKNSSPKKQSAPASPAPSVGASSEAIVTSMKDLNKNNPLMKHLDPKEIKQMVRQAPPGTSIVLPNGTVIKKSRRGGARAGAGRKRSRAVPGQGTSSGNSSQTNSASTDPGTG